MTYRVTDRHGVTLRPCDSLAEAEAFANRYTVAAGVKVVVDTPLEPTPEPLQATEDNIDAVIYGFLREPEAQSAPWKPGQPKAEAEIACNCGRSAPAIQHASTCPRRRWADRQAKKSKA